jgi:hypothetical protein
MLDIGNFLRALVGGAQVVAAFEFALDQVGDLVEARMAVGEAINAPPDATVLFGRLD